jgi:hypothetical protein
MTTKECIVCFESKRTHYFQKIFNCSHGDNIVCTNCMMNISKCPICRNESKEKTSSNITGYMNLIDLDRREWHNFNHDPCIKNNHVVLLKKPFGVLLICLTCSSITSYNSP